MSRLIIATSILAALVMTACGATPSAPSPSAPVTPPSPSAAPSTPVTPPSPSAAPTASPDVASPPPPADFSPAERYLLGGIRRDVVDCEPAGGSDDLPRDAIGGIECRSTDPAVARIGFYLFADDAAMLDAYFRRMTAEGVAMDAGPCRDGNGDGEMGHVPDEGISPDRTGCFVNDEGYANVRLTMSGTHVYIGILGRSADTAVLEDYAWRGNQDVPGSPTVWSAPD